MHCCGRDGVEFDLGVWVLGCALKDASYVDEEMMREDKMYGVFE